MTARTPVGNPRTPAEPMAFTRTEFLRGVRSAWLRAVLFDILAWTLIVFPAGGIISAFSVIPASFVAVAGGVVPAWWLGRALRSTARIPVHIMAFALFGGLVGAATTVAFFAVTGGIESLFGDGYTIWILVVNVVVSAFAVATGWWSTARRARGRSRPARVRLVGSDAVAEDAVIDRW